MAPVSTSSRAGWARPAGSRPVPPGRPRSRAARLGAGRQPPPGWQPARRRPAAPPGLAAAGSGLGTGPGWAGYPPPPPPPPKPGMIALRPLGVGEILDGSISAIRAHPRLMLGLSASSRSSPEVLTVPVYLAAAARHGRDTGVQLRPADGDRATRLRPSRRRSPPPACRSSSRWSRPDAHRHPHGGREPGGARAVDRRAGGLGPRPAPVPALLGATGCW